MAHNPPRPYYIIFLLYHEVEKSPCDAAYPCRCWFKPFLWKEPRSTRGVNLVCNLKNYRNFHSDFAQKQTKCCEWKMFVWATGDLPTIILFTLAWGGPVFKTDESLLLLVILISSLERLYFISCIITGLKQ